MYVWIYGHHIKQEYELTQKGCQSCSWSAQQGTWIIPCPRSRLRIWSRETRLTVPSRVGLLISILNAESGRLNWSINKQRSVLYESESEYMWCGVFGVWGVCAPVSPRFEISSQPSRDTVSFLHENPAGKTFNLLVFIVFYSTGK